MFILSVWINVAAGTVSTRYSWGGIFFIILCLAAVGAGAYAVYKYRIRVGSYFFEILNMIFAASSKLLMNMMDNLVLIFTILCLQRYMDSEIRAIMAQYMPLDNQGEIPTHASHGNI